MKARLLLLALFLPTLARAQPAVLDGLDLEPEGHWSSRLTIFATSPVALPSGMPVGASLETVRRFGDGPLHAGLSMSFSSATEANASWELRHHHLGAGALVGISRRLGVGLLFAQVGAGVVHVSERARRHQYDRLLALNVKDIEKRASALGPAAWAEAGVAVQLRSGFQVVASAGPRWTLLTVEGAPQSRAGALIGMGVRRAF